MTAASQAVVEFEARSRLFLRRLARAQALGLVAKGAADEEVDIAVNLIREEELVTHGHELGEWTVRK